MNQEDLDQKKNTQEKTSLKYKNRAKALQKNIQKRKVQKQERQKETIEKEV
jgi:hypothetical protein